MSRARILVVEDEGIIAEDIQISLQEFGYSVVGVSPTGEDAVDRAQDTRPDLVLMDVVLQGQMDGIEAARRIRRTMDIPVIYLTAFADEKMLERAKVTAPFAYMIKPFRERELHSNIEIALFKHQIDRKLKESREWFSGTLHSMTDAVIATDRTGSVWYMNPTAEQLTGIPLDRASGADITEVFRATDDNGRRFDASILMRLLEGGGSSLAAPPCTTLESATGETPSIDTRITPINDVTGAAVGSVIVFRDVTERKIYEQRLRLLSASVEQSSEGIAVTDLEGNFIFLNQALATLHGYSPEELSGRSLRVFHNSDQWPLAEKALAETIDRGSFSGELWYSRSDGSIFPALVQHTIMRGDDREPNGIIVTLRDISKLKGTEEALKRTNQALEEYSSSLEEMVRERTHDLEESKKELKRYSESLEKTNEALRLVIRGIEEQKQEVEQKITHNLNLTVHPILDQMKCQNITESVRFLVESLEFNLSNMFSSFGINIINEAQNLTPREIRICEMIRSGLTSKQMAKVLDVSASTVLVHRKNIRKKLGLAKSKYNLASYLKAKM